MELNKNLFIRIIINFLYSSSELSIDNNVSLFEFSSVVELSSLSSDIISIFFNFPE